MGRLIPKINQHSERVVSTKLPEDLYSRLDELLEEIESSPDTEKANKNRVLKELVILAITNKSVKDSLFKALKKKY